MSQCQVNWRLNDSHPLPECGKHATHRVVSTDGTGIIFQVCLEHAIEAANYHYRVDHFAGMKVGDPLWIIWPPLTHVTP